MILRIKAKIISVNKMDSKVLSWPGVRMSKYPLLACHIRCKFSLETSEFGFKKVKFGYKDQFGNKVTS